MTQSAIRRVYETFRSKGMPAKVAWQIARFDTSPPPHEFLADLGDYGKESVTGRVGPFDVAVRVVSDDESRLGDDDVTGTFTDTPGEGTVRNTTYGPNGQGLEFYQPSNATRECGLQEARARGMSKSVAREAYAQRVQAEMYEDAHREWYGVVVTVSVDGIELAHASVWGIDTTPGYNVQPYLWEVAADLIEEATTDARDRLPGKVEEMQSTVNALKAVQAADL